MRRLVLLAALVAAGCGDGSRGGSMVAASVVAPALSSTSTSTSTSTVRPVAPPPPPLRAGAARVDVTPPVGVPLAGYGGGGRRHPFPGNLDPNADDHLLKPSTGVRDPIHARALYLADGVHAPVAIVTIDAIATTDEFVRAVHAKARALGSTVAYEDLLVCASHTHSGPGCLTKLWVWQLTAADLYRDHVFQKMTDGVARAIVEAERAAMPALAGTAAGQLAGATHNRRGGLPAAGTTRAVDTELLVVRLDRLDGTPIATVWNFAIHGISLSDSSHAFSADVMGGANAELEARNQGVALFLNGAEGDVSPDFWGDSGIKTGGRVIADQVLATRAKATPGPSVPVASASETVDWGRPTLDVTLQRLGPQGLSVLTNQGWFTALTSLGVNPGIGVPLPAGWIEREFRHQAVRIGKAGLVSIPGEAIAGIGFDLKARGKALGFEHVLPCGLANGHAGYVVTEPEYRVGGYESICTLFGPRTAVTLVDASERRLLAVRP